MLWIVAADFLVTNTRGSPRALAGKRRLEGSDHLKEKCFVTLLGLKKGSKTARGETTFGEKRRGEAMDHHS